jgi:hypothetical protein
LNYRYRKCRLVFLNHSIGAYGVFDNS